MTSETVNRIVTEAVKYLDRNPDATVKDALMFGSLVELYLYGSPYESAAPVGLMGESPIHGLLRKTR